MFQYRPAAFDQCLGAIADQSRAIEKQLGGMTRTARDGAAAGASSAGTQFAEAVGSILGDIFYRLRHGRKLAADEAASFGNEAAESARGSAMTRWSRSQRKPRAILPVPESVSGQSAAQ